MKPLLFDWLSIAAGVSDAHWQLVAQAAVPPAATVLEVGAGTGNLLLKIKRAVPDATVIGLDGDAASLAVAAAKAFRHAVELQLDHGDATALPYPNGTFDRVLSSFVLHHLRDDQQLVMLREIGRVLKPGGSLNLVDFAPGGQRTVFPPLLPWLSLRHEHDAPSERHAQTGQMIDLMKQAGLLHCTEVGRGRSRLGQHAFYRATH